ncbi:hypothetical protein EBB07_05825 [Paenibacillaceae bacterium]|nr:hypothetical protein EBB07_05825 [Paenibacillaceae bacterium]
MIDFVLFFLFSILETSAMFYLVFKVFKIDIFVKEIVFASVIMGFISFVLRNEYHLLQLDLVIQIILMFLFIWLLFRIHIFYSIILVGMVYQIYFLIQSALFFLMDLFNLFHYQQPFTFSYSIMVLQILSASTAYSIGRIIFVKRKGFDFVPDKPAGKIVIKRQDKILMALTIPSITIGVTISILYFNGNLSQIYFLIPIVSIVILLGFLTISYKKDRGEYEHFSL